METIKNKIGNTRLVKAINIINKYQLTCDIYLKLEKDNYTGSSKDRLVSFIIEDALNNKLINKDTVIIEATSGNTGISLSKICNDLELKCIIIMPSNASKKRKEIIEKNKAVVIYTNAQFGISESLKLQKQLLENIPNSFTLDQFNNPLGVIPHYETTAKEIYNDLNGKIDIFISPIGTGTTFTGCSKFFKEKNNEIYCIGVEPFESNILNNGCANKHIIEGIGAGFIPNVLDISLIDEVMDISGEEALYYTKELLKEENLICGISSGASLAAGIKTAKKLKNKVIVCILPDDGNRYDIFGG